MRLTLRVKFLLLTTGAALGITGLILLTLSYVIRQEVDRSIHGSVRATGSVLAHFMQERSSSLKSQCLTFARAPVFKAYLGVSDPTLNGSSGQIDAATIVDSLQEYLKEMHVAAALMTDRDGRSLGETDAARQEKTDYSREAPVAAALQGETWSGIQARHGQLMLTVSVPVRIHNEVWGTFTAYSPIDSEVAGELHRALESDIAFVHQGRVVGSSCPLPANLPTPRSMPQVVTLNHKRYFALYAPLPDTDPSAAIGFVTLASYDQTMALSQRLQIALFGVAILALLLSLLTGLSVARGITRPLDGVVRAAQSLQEGGWPEPFQVRRSDEIGLLQSVFNEMTAAMRASQERLLALIDTDPLTELDNHRRFQERLEQETKRAAASGDTFALLLLNVDHFHSFNVRYGHVAGDQALQQIALVLRNSLPEFAISARYGGEEFAVILPDHTLEQAESMAEKLRALIEKQGSRLAAEEGLTVSIGCAQFGTHSTQGEGLVMAAELATARAKQLGRNRVCRFDSVTGGDETSDPYQLHRFMKDGSLATIQALAAAVDAKDPYTQGHSRRVAEYASRLAAEIGLTAAEVELIYTTGTLHDVGKIGVPDAILKKPERLTEDERLVMETHAVLGEVIVRKAPQLAASLPGVRHHHERWDGKGYPDNLAGEDIPLMARILAVADTYDAMTSDRPYRKGLKQEIALSEILKGAGTQFDPALTQPFVRMMENASVQPKAA